MRRVKIESARAPLRSPEPFFRTEAPPARGGRCRRQRDAERQLRRAIEEPSRRRGESATQNLSFQFLWFRTAFAANNSSRQSRQCGDRSPTPTIRSAQIMLKILTYENKCDAQRSRSIPLEAISLHSAQ